MARDRGLRLVIACALLLVCSALTSQPASAQNFSRSAVSTRDGNPTLLVDSRPFFFFGAAFFYERIPRAQWRASMLALHELGFNTLDLYIPWNWHELADGDFDFSGRTNDRRNLRAVLELAHELHFKLVVRPGPVIRNEWRNGGYPAWLLTRAEYHMPLHDVLEGRYPATATLQNASSDDAAQEWMHNATHMVYARRWLQTVLREFEPVAESVIAVQLDDDEGAYIDNQTWPAPHLQAYLLALEATVRAVVGPQLPVFINTFEMKVTASAPVWAMGNWYQSDTYSIGEHDRSALEFSTGLLQTQTRFPVAMSEFQAGWLAPPEDPAPRPADPTNTTLALHTLLGLGARGVIDFPAQDTVNPAGWEAPFANLSYGWDAALDANLAPSARYAPTHRFGTLLTRYGTELASARRLSDGAIAYLTSAYNETEITNTDVFAIAARTAEAQHACRGRHLTCDLIDLRFISDRALKRYRFVIVPPAATSHALLASVTSRLTRYTGNGGHVLTQPPDVVTPRNGGIADATLLLAANGAAFLDVLNYDSVAHVIPRTRIDLPAGRRWYVGPLTVPPRDALLLHSAATAGPARATSSVSLSSERLARTLATQESQLAARPATGIPSTAETPPATAISPTAAIAHNDAVSPASAVSPVAAAGSIAPAVSDDDRAGDGLGRVTLANGVVSVTLAPSAGARAFSFGAGTSEQRPGRNVFTSVGALRDDVEIQPPPSLTDRIGKYTRSFPAGTFNRSYRVESSTATRDRASVTFAYDAPDVVPNGARFERTIVMRRAEPAFTVSERVTFGAGQNAGAQRAIRYDSFDSLDATVVADRPHGAIGFFNSAAGTMVSLSWFPDDVDDAQLIAERTSTVVRLRFAAAGVHRTRYAIHWVTTITAAQTQLKADETALTVAQP